MGTLTKSGLTDYLVKEIPQLGRKEAKIIVENFFDEIKAALVRGDDVKISGFGNFHLRDKGSRPGRNPKNGQEIEISPRRVVTFHSSQKLRALITHFDKMLEGGSSFH
ncbi:MAG: integration host factor subunit alpha [Haemophilus parainfluenzae]|jgi:integration host factor subunit alpha|nr:MAG: integration host factor subunit alpha [Haemophilus parainfluenzae]